MGRGFSKKRLRKQNRRGLRLAAQEARKKRKGVWIEAKPKDYRGWTQVKCQALCGCCEAVFRFKTRAVAEAVCKEAALKHTKITDDEGESISVDGFGGFELTDL